MEKIIKMLKKYKEVISYLIFGVLTTVVSLAVYYLSVFTFLNPNNAFELQIANIISWIVGVCFAYFTNRKYVFESKEKNKLKEASKFVFARVVTLIMDMIIMWIGVTLLHRNDKIIKLISQVVIIVSNYVFSKIFVFKKKENN
ncbi:cell wall teichoic acid glycosylation protein GtcA [Clostridium sp. CAG:921]|nr:cell wall teichoic acid glycosylation protein GtcA [Clostridium sp. CAG:921]